MRSAIVLAGGRSTRMNGDKPSSHHKWSLYAKEKWYLITSLDDFSRYLFYAKLLKKETSWAHMCALQAVLLKHGFPFSYYVDCHSIFRFVQGRDSLCEVSKSTE